MDSLNGAYGVVLFVNLHYPCTDLQVSPKFQGVGSLACMCERVALKDLAASDSGVEGCLPVAAEVRPTQTHKCVRANTRAGTRKHKVPLSDGEEGKGRREKRVSACAERLDQEDM